MIDKFAIAIIAISLAGYVAFKIFKDENRDSLSLDKNLTSTNERMIALLEKDEIHFVG